MTLPDARGSKGKVLVTLHRGSTPEDYQKGEINLASLEPSLQNSNASNYNDNQCVNRYKDQHGEQLKQYMWGQLKQYIDESF